MHLSRISQLNKQITKKRKLLVLIIVHVVKIFSDQLRDLPTIPLFLECVHYLS